MRRRNLTVVSQIAYFGPEGTFTEQAARTFSAEAQLIPIETIPLALASVRNGEVEAVCVPVENSVEGAVSVTLDALAEDEPLVAIDEVLLSVHFSLLSKQKSMNEIRTVASHPHALAQVRKWLAANMPQAIAVAASSTAAAAIAVQRGEFDAAITAPIAVEHYPLTVLATGLADVTDAQTRFLLLKKPGSLPAQTGADRTSIIAIAANRVGALSDLLSELTCRGINLTKLDARPMKENFGEYRFFIDFEGHIAEPRISDALAALHRRCDDVRFLGSHPRADGGCTAGHQLANNDDFVTAAQWVTAVQRGELA